VTTCVDRRVARLRKLVLIPAAIFGLIYGAFAETARGLVYPTLEGWLGAVPIGIPVLLILSLVLWVAPAWALYRIVRWWRTPAWAVDAARTYGLPRADLPRLLAASPSLRRRLVARLPTTTGSAAAPPTTGGSACATCSQPATEGTCPRCGAATCLEHMASARSRCPACEHQYLQTLSQASHAQWFLAGFIPPWITFALVAGGIARDHPIYGGMWVMTTGLPVLDAFIMTLVGAIVLGRATVEVRNLVARHRFLLERAAESPCGGSVSLST